MALFGERYGDEVRVLSMGMVPEDEAPFSIELCGGTHVNRTGDIGLFKIINESGISAGIRRIEAFTGLVALDYVTTAESTLAEVSALVKSTALELPGRIDALITEKKSLERQVAELQRKSMNQEAVGRKIGDIDLYELHVKDVSANDLKPLMDNIKQKIGSGVVVLTSVSEAKVSLLIGVTPDLTSRISAIDLVRAGAKAIGGSGGGGRPDLAQAGGTNTDITAAVVAIETFILSQ